MEHVSVYNEGATAKCPTDLRAIQMFVLCDPHTMLIEGPERQMSSIYLRGFAQEYVVTERGKEAVVA